ncbi:hypothetical protein FY145_01080 [Agrobacterium tumefaciens]|uniref:spike base protein, RCAP_Rcc01079 family n=1 Tax=Agrobacterium tumefaciens TaxID=358 RepID=UPI0021D37641|nr:hypothetical protein [Agrobacterium tumefaciens]UXS69168.1 hypothetical protein FY146_01080 [Agrobacterium tumefaciens]UXS76831.1 hypothetical protein FY145_01080 [Agrobacterium tumefaciens]
MSDWRNFGRDSTSPAEDVIAIDVSGGDHTPMQPYRALRANAAGTIRVDTLSGSARTLNFTDGETRAIYVQKVYQTGTTATGIEGMV